MGENVLESKIRPPKIKGKLLRRTHLLDKLQDNLDKKLILVCADAGYGKTTLLADLVSCIKMPHTWYTLDRDDNSTAVILRHMIYGIQNYLASFGESLLPRLNQASSQALLKSFVNELHQIPHVDLVFVLDDYQYVSSIKGVNEALMFLIKHAPANIHFIIASRVKPVFSIARLKAKGDFFVLSSKDLSFSYAETRVLYHDIWNIAYDEKALRTIWSKTAGWITGLFLLYTYLRDRGSIDPTALPIDVREDLYNYFTHELFVNQPESIQHFLLQTSVFETLRPELCNDLLRIKNSSNIINRLLDKGLFTYCVDKENNIYQYHPLFREFLLINMERTFSRAGKMRLYKKIGKVFMKHGELAHALAYFIKTEEWDRAGKILYKTLSKNQSITKFLSIATYIHKIPEKQINSTIALLYAQAMHYYYQSRLLQALECMRKLEKKLKNLNDTKKLRRVYLIIATIHIQEGRWKKGLLFADKALRLRPRSRERAGILCLAKGPALHFLGKPEEAKTILLKAYGIYEQLNDTSGIVHVLDHLGGLSMELGELDEAREYFETSLSICAEGIPTNTGETLKELCWVYTVLGEEKKALDTIDRLFDLHERSGVKAIYGHGLFSLGIIKMYEDDADANLLFGKAIEVYRSLNDNFAVIELNLWQGNASRFQGDTLKAVRCIKKASDLIKKAHMDSFMPWYNMHKGILDSIQGNHELAERELKSALRAFARYNARFDMFQCYLYLAYMYYTSNNEKQLLYYIAKVLRLAKHYRYERFFMLEKRISVALLIEYFKLNPEDEYVQSLLIRMGKYALTELLSLINSRNLPLASSVIQLIGRIGDPSCVRALEKYKKSKYFADEVHASIGTISVMHRSVFRLQFFGKMQVYRDDTLIESWKYKPALQLFQILVINKGRRLHREEIAEMLWPKSSFKKSSVRFYMALSKLRKHIDPERTRYSRFSAIRLEKEYCWIETSSITSYDVDEFLELSRTGRILEDEDTEAAVRSYQQAIDIYQNDFLADEQYADWVEVERRRLREKCIEILMHLAADALQKGDYTKAIVYYKRILSMDPCHEHSHAQLMLCYIKVNDRTKAIQQYETCKKTLHKNLGLNPSAAIKRLFKTYLT
jgi:LuxR family maltose regulon positive regulatory protein